MFSIADENFLSRKLSVIRTEGNSLVKVPSRWKLSPICIGTSHRQPERVRIHQAIVGCEFLDAARTVLLLSRLSFSERLHCLFQWKLF